MGFINQLITGGPHIEQIFLIKRGAVRSYESSFPTQMIGKGCYRFYTYDIGIPLYPNLDELISQGNHPQMALFELFSGIFNLLLFSQIPIISW